MGSREAINRVDLEMGLHGYIRFSLVRKALGRVSSKQNTHKKKPRARLGEVQVGRNTVSREALGKKKYTKLFCHLGASQLRASSFGRAEKRSNLEFELDVTSPWGRAPGRRPESHQIF